MANAIPVGGSGKIPAESQQQQQPAAPVARGEQSVAEKQAVAVMTAVVDPKLFRLPEGHPVGTHDAMRKDM